MRRTTAALGVVVALAVLVLTSTATGAIDHVTGDITFLTTAPPSVQFGALSSTTTMYAFDEQQHVALPADLDVDITQPGTYASDASLTTGKILKGTIVNSEFVHFDTPNRVILHGTIHTGPEILGVAVNQFALNRSDFLGAPGTAYPTNENGRGLELGNNDQQDLVIEEVDRHTITYTADVRTQKADQIRIITKANTPPSVHSGGAASGAEGSAIALSGSATDPDGPVASTWTYVTGGGVDAGATCAFGDASSPSTSITCTDDGHYTATLTADDGSGAVMDTASVDVANAKPSVSIASPSGGSSYGAAPVSLSAPFTDAGRNDSHTCSIDWGDASPASAGTVTESNGSGTCSGSHTYSTGGAHTIAATVTDDNGGSGSASVTVVNAAPSVDAGSNGSGLEGSAIGLGGSVSDPDGPAGTSSWAFAPGPGVDAGAACSFGDASSPATTVTCTDDGVYTVTLTANDGLNAPVSRSATVVVSNAAPLVAVTQPSGGSYGAAPVSASASFHDAGTNDTHTCSIAWGDGSPVSTGTVTEGGGSGTCTGSHAYTTGGSHTIVVTVTDDDGAPGSDSKTVANAAPSVSAGPNASGAEGSAINLNGVVSDPDGPAGTTSWSYTTGPGVDAGATCTFGSASSPATTITCTDDGTYTVRLTSSDGLNPAVSSTATVTVSNAAPVVTITSPAVGATYTLTTPVAVSAAFTDAGKNDTHTCKVNWGDATPLQTGTVVESNGAGTCTATHTYTTGGAHTIAVTVTDDDTAAGTDTRALAAATAMSLKQGVLNQALALMPTATKLDQVRLALIAIGVGFSLQPNLWVDGTHVKESSGSCVFTGEEGAILVLQDLLLHGSIPAATVQGMINNLLAADQILAQTAINDAVAAHGNSTKIADAKKELTNAATSIAHSDPNGAIDHYELAWAKAEAAF